MEREDEGLGGCRMGSGGYWKWIGGECREEFDEIGEGEGGIRVSKVASVIFIDIIRDV